MEVKRYWRQRKKGKNNVTVVPKKLNAKDTGICQQRSRNAVWGAGGRCLEQRRVEKCSAVLPGSK